MNTSWDWKPARINTRGELLVAIDQQIMDLTLQEGDLIKRLGDVRVRIKRLLARRETEQKRKR